MTGIHRSAAALLLGATAFGLAPQAVAQSVDAGVEATTDEVRRGLSWSDGELSASADARASLAGFDASVRVSMLRQSDRHANADVVADLGLGKEWNAGAFTLRAEAVGHVFGNADAAMNYGEVGLGARYSIGPLQFGTMAWYAPKQDNIGGDNLHLRATADAGLPGFPITIYGAVGYTTGDMRDGRSARLRPAGDYADWKIGAEFNRFPFTFGVDYVGTDIDTANTVSVSPFADLTHAGDRVLGRVRLSF